MTRNLAWRNHIPESKLQLKNDLLLKTSQPAWADEQISAMNQNTCCFGGNSQIPEFIILTIAGTWGG